MQQRTKNGKENTVMKAGSQSGLEHEIFSVYPFSLRARHLVVNQSNLVSLIVSLRVITMVDI